MRLILLSIFDTVSHPELHDGFLLLFVAGYVISVIFICAEYQRLGIHFRQHRVLRGLYGLNCSSSPSKSSSPLCSSALASPSDIKASPRSSSRSSHSSLRFMCLPFFVDLLPASRDQQKITKLEMGNVDGPAAEHQSNGYATPYGGHIYDGAASGVAYGQRPKPLMAQNY